MKKMTSQITPKHMLDNKILLKLEKIFNSIEIIPNSTYPLSEPSVQCSLLLKHEILKKLVTYSRDPDSECSDPRFIEKSAVWVSSGFVISLIHFTHKQTKIVLCIAPSLFGFGFYHYIISSEY